MSKGTRKSIQRVVVTAHAMERYRQRARDWQTPAAELRDHVEALVREGLASGQVRTHKPAAFMLYGERRVQLMADERCICTPDLRWAFLGRIEGETFVVRTVLAPVAARVAT